MYRLCVCRRWRHNLDNLLCLRPVVLFPKDSVCSPLRSIQNSIQTVYSTGCTHINQETIHILEMFNPSAMELETLDAKKSIFYHKMMCNTKLIFNLYFCDLHNQLDTGKVILGPSSFSLTGPRLRCY